MTLASSHSGPTKPLPTCWLPCRTPRIGPPCAAAAPQSRFPTQPAARLLPSSRYRPLRSIFSHLNGEHPGYSVPAARPDGVLHDPVQNAPDIPAAVYRELYQELTGQLTGLQFSSAQANALLGLLESQCSALPANTAWEEDRDISQSIAE